MAGKIRRTAEALVRTIRPSLPAKIVLTEGHPGTEDVDASRDRVDVHPVEASLVSMPMSCIRPPPGQAPAMPVKDRSCPTDRLVLVPTEGTLDGNEN